MIAHLLRRLRCTLDAILSRARFERDLRDEVRQHLDARSGDLIASGVPPADASRQARVEFGAMETYKELCRDARGFAPFRPFHGLAADVRLGARRLLATPQFLAFAVLSLAVGIGVTTAVYSILYSLLWQPMAIADPATAVFVAAPGGGGRPLMRARLSDVDFRDLQDAQRTMSAVAASLYVGLPLAGPARTEYVEGEAVTADYFRVTGIVARRGRTIGIDDDTTAAAVMVISDRVWRARFDADPHVVGRVVRFGGRPFAIIGVAAPGFDGINHAPTRTGVWIPLSAAAGLAGVATPAATPPPLRLTVLGRLAAGRSAHDAAADVAAVARRLDVSRPLRVADAVGNGTTVYVTKRPWSARAADDTGVDADSRVATLVVLLVALVLGVACTNLANLMLARGALRQQEFAVRRALGASRWRLVRELCVEGGLVALMGGAAAVLLLALLLRLATVDMPLPRGIFSIEPQMNVPALAVAAAALLLSMLVFGVEPALQLTRGDVVGDFAGAAAIGVPRWRRQQAFIRWQVAISAAFFLVAAILARVILSEVRHDTGVDVDRLAIATVHFPAQGLDEARATRVLHAATAYLRGERDIESVALSSGVPFGMTMTPFTDISTADRPFVKGVRYPDAYVLASTPDIFRTLGVPILRGRAFDARDDKAAPRVSVISEITARTLFGTADAIGRQISIRPWGRPPVETYMVAGIAGDTDTGEATRRKDGVVYIPLAQHFERGIAIIARTSGDTWTAARLIQTAVRRADPDLGTGTAGPGPLVMAGEFFAARVAASFASALGLVTLLMAMVGLYGIQSHVVARRTREVGVRMAIGASAAQIERMVLGEGYRPVLQGLALGLLFGVLARLVLRATVNAAIAAFDPLAFALVPIPLVAAAFLACYLPARRAARVDPNDALRHL
jgi:predicted permease